MAAPLEVKTEVKKAFLADGCSIRDLAERFKLEHTTIAKWARNDGWWQLKPIVSDAIDASATRDARARIAAEAERDLELWREFHSQIEDKLFNAPDGVPADILESLARTAEKTQKGKRVALGAESFDGQPMDLEVAVSYEGLELQIRRQMPQIASEADNELDNPEPPSRGLTLHPPLSSTPDETDEFADLPEEPREIRTLAAPLMPTNGRRSPPEAAKEPEIEKPRGKPRGHVRERGRHR